MLGETSPQPKSFPARITNSDEALGQRFMHHPPVGNQAQRYGEIRKQLLVTAIYCRDRTPQSPEQTRAFNALDEAMFLFNAAIARNEPRDIPAYTTTEHVPVAKG